MKQYVEYVSCIFLDELMSVLFDIVPQHLCLRRTGAEEERRGGAQSKRQFDFPTTAIRTVIRVKFLTLQCE